MEHNSIASRRKCIGDFSLNMNSTIPLHTSDQLLSTLNCRRNQKPSTMFPALILPYLYLGNDETAQNINVLNRCDIRYIINVTSNLPNYFEENSNFCYLRIPVDDSCSNNLFDFFPEAISFIDKARAERASVLVHCWAGISRSVTVCLAYLMYALHNTFEEAFDLLLKQNGAIAPNFHFLETLTCWERQLFENFDSSSQCNLSKLPSSSSVSIESINNVPIPTKFSNIDINCSIDESCHNLNNQHDLYVSCHKTCNSSNILYNEKSSMFVLPTVNKKKKVDSTKLNKEKFFS